ncbi:zinc-dependent metalloprotease [Pedobacter polysacchareus]|uniref:zinc-dependent metalloprotease n=1 Tax=Pedobacter polysacchareus TaxID=2861973 RepID=UPI001C997F36|nr:zinc-dependent metalloprotease [Pedobacter polysacchareus]
MNIIKYSKYLLLGLFLSSSMVTLAQKSKRSKQAKNAVADTTKKAADKPKIDPNKKIKPYESIINKNFKTQKGLFGVHRYRDTVYFEIADSLLKRDVMVINSLSKAPGGYGMYAGEQLDEKTIQFEKGADSSIRIRYNILISEADPNSAINKAVLRSSLNPLVASFPIVAYSKDSSSCIIDVSKFLMDVNFINSINPGVSLEGNLTSSFMKNVTIESIRAYPINVEIAISKTMMSKANLVNPNPSPVSLETNTSFVLLPKIPMQRRFFDKRVGYFGYDYKQFDDHQQRAEVKKFISRWRLEPKDADVEKWKKGELVEPKKPIVIYIDPATPKQWVQPLIDGVSDWQVAFEKAGFKNAIIGKPWPENDTTMHIDDIRYSMINYFPSEVANAYGPHIADPRSGEIIQTHIGWYHNVMDLLNKWYLIQAGATDPEARKGKFDEKLMGQLIRFVSSHEVGHTLGLRHNFGSSSKTPVDSLRNLNYLKKYGHTASIMDYARFNYVAQPEDHIPQKYLFPRIGDYDQWAIEWGYKSSHAATAEEDEKIVKQWIVDRVGKNPRLWFGDGETKRGDPRVQTEDLGDNSMKASSYGIKNLKRILPNLKTWTYEKGGLYGNTERTHSDLLKQYYRYLNHVLSNVGGIYRTYSSEDEKLPVYSATPRKLQLEAIQFFDKELFTTPTWLLNANIQDSDMDPTFDPKQNPTGSNFVEDMQIKTLNTLLDISVLHQILANNLRFGKGTYTVVEHLNGVHNSIWKELKSPSVKMDSYRRNLQKSYVGSLLEVVISKVPGTTETDVYSLVKAELKALQSSLKQAIPKTHDSLNKYHLTDLENRISKVLNSKS